MQDTINGIHYQYQHGQGRPIIFLHGWLGTRNSWGQVREHLDRDNPQLSYDQRCHGNSKTEPFTFTDLADDLQTLIDHLGLSDPILAGHSMGGMVALTHAVDHGTHPLFLAGTCASTPEPERGSPQFFLDQLDSMERHEWAAQIAANYAPGGALQDMAQQELQQAEREPLEHSLRAMIDWDIREHLSAQQALVIAAEHDQAVTGDKTQELASLLDCEHRTIQSSHLMLQEKPGEMAQLLEGFLDSLQS